jgi:WbqC-like protein family
MSPKTIVVLQSCYIPWKGYFDLIAVADEFLLFDEVQFTKNDWRNRNRIVLGGRLQWLTLPVHTAGCFGAAIERVEVSRPDWAKAHWDTLRQAYRHAPHYRSIAPILEEAYRTAAPFTRLSRINEHFLKAIATLLDLKAPIIHADVVPRTTSNSTDRLLEICKARGATDYVSGPAAHNYLRIAAFREAGIALHFANYAGYPVYSQGREQFEHGVSMIDTLMQCGLDARGHLKALGDRAAFLSPPG